MNSAGNELKTIMNSTNEAEPPQALGFAKSHKSGIQLQNEFLQRHQFSLEDLKHTLAEFDQLKVCVIGDTIVDEYVQCDPKGVSQEDQTVVFSPNKRSLFVGGAAIVASHLKGLGVGGVDFFSVLGDDELAHFVEERCSELQIKANLIRDKSRSTSLKQRFRSKSKPLLRLNSLFEHPISERCCQKILEQFFSVADATDVVIFSDYSYGMLPQRLVRTMTEYCQTSGIMMVADSQSSSQSGDIGRFPNMNIVTPTEYEIRQSLCNGEDELSTLPQLLREKSGAEHVLVTMGEEGVLINTPADGVKSTVSDLLPAFNRTPVDCMGAGDCFLAATALAMATGADIWQSAYLGNIAAACQVSRIGNLPLTATEMHSVLDNSVVT